MLVVELMAVEAETEFHGGLVVAPASAESNGRPSRAFPLFTGGRFRLSWLGDDGHGTSGEFLGARRPDGA